MKTKSSFPSRVSNLQVTKLPCFVRAVQGFWNGANDPAWLQIWDTDLAAADAGGSDQATLLKSLAVSKAFAFSWEYWELTCSKGLLVVTSSTPAVLTLTTADADIEVEYQQQTAPTGVEPTRIAEVFPDQTAEVWSTGVHRLMSLDVTSAETGTSYVQVHAKTPVQGAVPLLEWSVEQNVTLRKQFGPDGRAIYDGAGNRKCYLAVSVSKGIYDATGAGGANTFDASYV